MVEKNDTVEISISKEKEIPEKLKVFYVDEFFYGNDLRKRSVERPEDSKIGMSKIQAKTPMGKYWVDFANTSTVHGLNHLTAPHRHVVERIITSIFIILALVILILLSMSFWHRYQTSPTVILIDHDNRKFSIVKPSIIICPTSNINESLFPTVFAKYGVQDTDEARKFFTFLSNATFKTFDKTPNYSAVDPSKWLHILYDLRPIVLADLDPKSLGWMITGRGLCLSYLNYARAYVSMRYWEQNNWTIVTPPNKLPEMTYLNREYTDTMRIDSHDVEFAPVYPGDLLESDRVRFYTANRLSIVRLDLLVTVVTSSSRVQKLSPSQRQCLYPHEGGLKLYPIYSDAMCHQECKYMRILKLCGCHPHFVRPIPGIPRCNVSQLVCIGKHSFQITYGSIEADCDCRPDCDIIRYDEDLFAITSLKEGSPTNVVITIALIFPPDTYKREEVFGFNDFLASVGGAAGLLLGASVISFMEIFYFLTLGLFWQLVKVRREKKHRATRNHRLINVSKLE